MNPELVPERAEWNLKLFERPQQAVDGTEAALHRLDRGTEGAERQPILDTVESGEFFSELRGQLLLVVLADEPSGNLDPGGTGQALLEIIWNLSRTHQLAFVIVTHDEEIGRRADRMVRLADGQLVELNQEINI